MSYRHTQIGYKLIAVLAIPIWFATLFWIIAPAPHAAVFLYTIFPFVASTILFFPLMTIEVRDGYLSWRFGLLKKRVALSDIVRITPVTITLVQDGVGIHITADGCVYTVKGCRAVEFALKDGRKIQLGTDEPEALILAVTSASNLAPSGCH